MKNEKCTLGNANDVVEIRAAGRSTLHIQTSQLGEQRATANGHPDGRPGCPTIDRLWGKDKIIKSSHDTLIMSVAGLRLPACWLTVKPRRRLLKDPSEH
jgi:hypothetical protein